MVDGDFHDQAPIRGQLTEVGPLTRQLKKPSGSLSWTSASGSSGWGVSATQVDRLVGDLLDVLDGRVEQAMAQI